MGSPFYNQLAGSDHIRVSRIWRRFDFIADFKRFCRYKSGGGFLSAVAGSAGPLGAAFFLGLNLPPLAYVASEAVTAVVMHLTKTIMYNKYALVGTSELLLGGFLGLAMILGSWTGKKVIQKLSREKFLLLVEILLVISGIQLIFFA